MLEKHASLTEVEDAFMQGIISKYRPYVVLMKAIGYTTLTETEADSNSCANLRLLQIR